MLPGALPDCSDASPSRETICLQLTSEIRHDMFQEIRQEIRRSCEDQKKQLNDHEMVVAEFFKKQQALITQMLSKHSRPPSPPPREATGLHQPPLLFEERATNGLQQPPLLFEERATFRRQQSLDPTFEHSRIQAAWAKKKSSTLLDLPTATVSQNIRGSSCRSSATATSGKFWLGEALDPVTPQVSLNVIKSESDVGQHWLRGESDGTAASTSSERNQIQQLTLIDSVTAAAAIAASGQDDLPLNGEDSLSTRDSDEHIEEMQGEWKQEIKNKLADQLRGTKARQVRHDSDVVFHSSSAKKLQQIANSPSFNSWCCAVVLGNALLVGIESSISMSRAIKDGKAPDLSLIFKPLHLTFALLFVLEVLLRLSAARQRFFLGYDRNWNIFDAILVIIAIFEELMENTNFGFLRVFRCLRVIRVVRLVRVVRLIPDLMLMITSIFQSFFSFFWGLSLLFVMNYLASVVFMQGAVHFLTTGVPSDKFYIEIETWYCSLFRTFITMTMCITGGVDWFEVVRPLHEIGWVYEILFVLYILFVVIGVLNVLTGIFVERAQELSGLDRDLVIQSEMKRNSAFLSEMKGIFQEADKDASGKISWEEFRDYVENPEVKAYLATQQLDTYDARQIFDVLELEDGQEVGMEEFIMGCMRLKGMAKSVDVVALLQESRKHNRKMKDTVADIQDQIAMIAGKLGLGGDEMPTRRASFARGSSRKVSISRHSRSNIAD